MCLRSTHPRAAGLHFVSSNRVAKKMCFRNSSTHSSDHPFDLEGMANCDNPFDLEGMANCAADINYVRLSMKKWVQEYVIDHQLCPFAVGSDYRVAVWEMYDVNERSINGMTAKEFIESEINKLLDASTSESQLGKRPSTLVVFPFVDEFIEDGPKFYAFSAQIAESIPCIGDKSSCNDSEHAIEIFPFHLDQDWRFKTPFPTLHLLRMSDANEARKGGGNVTENITQQNDTFVASESTQEELGEILIRLTTFPEPIHVTKSISSMEKAKLLEQGVRVIDSKVAMKKPELSEVRIKKPKKNQGKRKPRR